MYARLKNSLVLGLPEFILAISTAATAELHYSDKECA